MAARATLAANLPAAPLTSEQRALFDQHLPLAEYMTSIGVRKYGGDMHGVLRCATLTGLMCAAARYQVPSEATFKTFAANTINWVMRLEVRRELGQKAQDPEHRRAYMRNKFNQKPHPTFEPSAYRAAGELHDVVFERNESFTAIPMTRINPEQLLEEKREQLLARRALARLKREHPRNARIFERWLNDETYESIGVSYKISRQRVQQLVKKTLKRAAEVVERAA